MENPDLWLESNLATNLGHWPSILTTEALVEDWLLS